ncbi:MAG: C25 family cysteine peptidase [bacterium]
MIPVIFMLMFVNNTMINDVAVNSNDLILQVDMEYTKIMMKGYDLSDQVGAPELPVKAVRIALPYGAQVTGIHIISEEVAELAGEYLPTFVQPPYILSLKHAKKLTTADQAIYSSNTPYPENILVFKGSSVYDNYQICELLFYPVQYLPRAKKLKIYNSIKFSVTYEGGQKQQATSNRLKEIVINPGFVTQAPDYRQTSDFDYLIITNSQMETAFQTLADWKTKKGIKTEIRTVTWILANYTGEDNAAAIRNYLKTLPDSNVQYVLLGGDTDVIPCRFAFAMACSAGMYPGREDTMPSDLYYGDLQGTWDYDNDGSYGEIEDSIDLYPDLLVGRAPVNSVSEAQTFVNKVLVYEKTPDLTYQDNAMFSADVLWSNPYTDMAVHKNKIENESFPGYYNITKLYHSQGNLSPTAFKNALRQGQGLTNHDGHGWIDVMGAGTGYLRNADFDTLTNAPKFGVLASIGCWTTAYDFNCIAESYINSPNGGGVVFFGNSSYGWGSPGNPGFGYSDRFDSRLFYGLLKENQYHAGDMLASCKVHFIPYSREKNVYRWHQYQLNLLGDPEMPIWTDIPETLTVSYPQSIPQGNSRVFVTVKDKNTETPIKGALVCLMKGSESYAAGYTDAAGTIFLNASATSTGNFDITVTVHNYIPQESTIPVVNGSYVNYLGWAVEDSLGNGDGIANPNEDIFLDIIIKNNGNATSNNILLTLRSQDPFTSIQDSTESLGSLNVGDSVYISNAFYISVGSAINGHGIHFDLEVIDDARTLNYKPTLLIGTPVLNLEEVIIAQPPVLPGDTESISLEISNTGYGFAHNTYALLSTSDPYVTILTDSVFCGEIPPETKVLLGSFSVSIASSCPAGHHPTFLLDIIADDYATSKGFLLIVGETGFSDDMESGSSLWTTAGTNNLWHISTRRSFSPTHAWYCGNESSGQYVNNMDCYIQTIPFMINANSILKFYRWFSVPLYGTDGIYVIIMGNGFADTLDFIGTGGALGGRGIQSEWFEQKYELSSYPAGDTIQVRIAFISDGGDGVGEGFYIDDINAEYVTLIEEYTPKTVNPNMLAVHPNPFRNKTDITFSIGQSAECRELKIYDATGRLVRNYSINLSNLNKSAMSVCWDGTDELNRKVPAGIYFVQLETDTHRLTRKAILLR